MQVTLFVKVDPCSLLGIGYHTDDMKRTIYFIQSLTRSVKVHEDEENFIFEQMKISSNRDSNQIFSVSSPVFISENTVSSPLICVVRPVLIQAIHGVPAEVPLFPRSRLPNYPAAKQ